MTEKKSIVTSAVPDPSRIDVGDRKAPTRTYSGEWVIPPPGVIDDSLPKSMREVLERIHAEHLDYFRRHPEDVDLIERSYDYLEYVGRLETAAVIAAATEGHWAHRNARRYVELLGVAYVWAKLSE